MATEDQRAEDVAEAPPPGLSADAEHYRRQLDTVARNATLALFIMDEHQHCTYMNPAAERLTGFSLDEVRGKALHYYVHHTRPDGSHYPLEECPIDQAFPQNMREQGEETFVHKDGHFYPVAFTASPILEDGRPVGTIIEVRDITDERAAEQRRLQREADVERLVAELEVERGRLTTIFEQAPAFIATLRGPDHVFEMTNPTYREMIGERDVLGLTVAEGLPEVVEQGFVDLLDEVYRTGTPYVGRETQVFLRRADRDEMEEIFVNFVFQPLEGGAGIPDGILVHGVDVTDLVHARFRQEEQATELETQAEELRLQNEDLEEVQVELETANQDLQDANEALALGQARLQAVVDNAPVGIVIAEAPSGEIVLGNKRVEEIFRHPVLHSASLEDYGEWEAYHPDGRRVQSTEYPLARAIATGRRAGPDEYHYQRGDGTRAWVRITGAPIMDAAGQVTGGLVVVDDIDEEKRSAQERADLLAAVEEERRLLRQVFENAPAVMALYTGRDHVVELVNPTWLRTVGKPDAVGKPFKEVFPEFEGTGLYEKLEEVYRTGEPYLDPEVNVPLVRWEGDHPENTYWDLAWLPLGKRPDGERDILVHAIEITDQVRAREQVRQLSMAALAVHSAPSLAEALDVLTAKARDIIGAHQAVTSMTENRAWAQAINSVSLSEKYGEWAEYGTPPDGSGIYAMVCERNEPMRMTQAQLEAHPRFKNFSGEGSAHPPMRGWLAAPLKARDGRNLGLIQLSDRFSGEFTEQDEAILAQLAQMGSVAVENAQLYEQAVEANRVKSGFLATMSHELRTPLNAMIGYAQLLETGIPEPIPDASKGQVERIRLAAQHLLQLIEEILTFSRADAGRERVNAQAVPLSELVDEVGAILEPLARERDLDFEMDVPDRDVVLHTDPRKVRQILLNILGNAIKFTPEGEVCFRARPDGDWLIVEVADTGIGIAKDNLERIFEPFWQAESEIHVRVSGTGLGLPVTRQLVELLGGTLQVVSALGEGTTFTVRLPLNSVPGDPPAQT